jgi:predicted glycosyl hydrolase (DUF1957 family)
MYIFLAFAFGCTLTYLITILSSAIRSSEILENAMLTYALLMMSAFEVSVQQLENTIVRNRIDKREAEKLRRIHKNEFQSFADKKIREIIKYIPPSHENIMRYKNFEQMNLYITQQYRRQNAKSKQN